MRGAASPSLGEAPACRDPRCEPPAIPDPRPRRRGAAQPSLARAGLRDPGDVARSRRQIATLAVARVATASPPGGEIRLKATQATASNSPAQ
ncbi:hypothetical protein NL676_001042 [Syzygium grande]|nr:hypothetical protein NL676_001042 [Syzygium grande]